MSPARLIREGIQTPGPAAYFAVAASAALIVLAVAGYFSRFAHADSYLPPDIASASTSSSSAQATLVQAGTRVDAAMSSQVVMVDASNGRFSPNQITVRAGVPVQLVFTEGESCTSRIRLDSLNMLVPLNRDGLVVRLPALKRGVYPFSCAHGSAVGFLLAE